MKRTVNIALALGLIGALGGYLFMQSDTATGLMIGTNYVAKSLCSCVLLQHRDIDACYADMMNPQARSIPVVIDEAGKTVTTSILGVFRGKAVFVEGQGCYLD